MGLRELSSSAHRDKCEHLRYGNPGWDALLALHVGVTVLKGGMGSRSKRGDVPRAGAAVSGGRLRPAGLGHPAAVTGGDWVFQGQLSAAAFTKFPNCQWAQAVKPP